MPTNNNYDTEALWRQDLDHFIHPWTDFSTFKQEGSLVMAESEGAYVIDSEGKKYIDGIGGLWCVNIGYANDEMADAIAEQARRIPYYSTFNHITTPPAAELAAKLAELAPETLRHIFYGTGGSMANDTAIRIVHYYFNRLGKPKKKKIISRVDGYHGSTYLAMTLTGVEFDHQGFDLAPGLVHYIPAPNPYRRPQGMTIDEFCDEKVKDLENKILELGPDNVACFIAEPIMGAGGVIVPPPGYHKRTRDVCSEYDVLYISDEVVTGFGRLGEFFSSKSVFGFTPDIITCAKGISSGYVPLSATILSESIYDVISVPQVEGGMFTHGFTYSGHPISCAAGLKNIEIMEREAICNHVREIGPYLESQLSTLLEYPIVGDVRGSHFMMCIENVADKETKSLLPDEAEIGNRIATHCQERGLIVRPIAHLNVLSPPLIMTRSEIDTMVEVLHESIRATQDDLTREGIWKNS
ncbi:MAG: aspartate aminotransferase family protein [Acidiferrobacteraceae bacterium]|nr:aspartate aminotransferase family protein [Acidiferrobacteraceae bacterium]